jgi:putative methionine-R-sulfoxide reductase with GAF domain
MTSTLTPSWLLPLDEAKRLHTLHHYDSAQGLHEPVFTELVSLVARLFGLPIALITLVEAEHVVCQASFGLPGVGRQARAESLCSLAIKQNKAVVFNDLLKEAAWHHLSPATAAVANAQRYGLRFYAGVPVRMPDQRPIGTLCVCGPQPRAFSAEEQQLLAQLSRVVSTLLVVRHSCKLSALEGDTRRAFILTQTTEEVRELDALVRYLVVRFGSHEPMQLTVLQPVARRLNGLLQFIAEYQIEIA